MALKALIPQEDFDGTDESLKALYRQTQDGAWVLEVDSIDSHPNVKSLASTLRKFKEVEPDATKLRAMKDELARLREAWEGLDPETTRSRLTRLEEFEAGDKPDVKTRIEQAKEEARRAYEKELKKRDDEAEALKGELGDRDNFIHRLTVDQELDSAFAHGKVIEGLRPGARAYLKLTHKPEVERVVDEDTGKVSYRAIVKTATGEPAIADFVAQWLTTDEAQEYLPPSGNVGTNSKSGGGGNRAYNPYAKDTFNLTKQGEMELSNPALAAQMKAAAGG